MNAVVGVDSKVLLDLQSKLTLETAPGRLLQAFEYVVRNARQAVEHESAITVSSRDEGDEVVVRVEDKGVGIPPEVLPKIFQPYFTTKDARQGTGLGLNIVQRLVKEGGGVLHVDTRPGEGTAFTIYLPAATVVK